MKVIFNITENKNKVTFQQEVVKINTSFNQTQNIVKPKFQVGYYPLPVGLENYYTKNETYSQTEIDNSLALKLDKGTYTGNASDLFLNDQNLLQSLQNEQSARYSADQDLENSKQKKLTIIPITGNTTLSETHNGAILHITNTCNITIPTGLDANFQCVVYAKGSIIVTFVNGGVTLNSPSGLLLKTDKMASLFASASNTFNLLGELTTS